MIRDPLFSEWVTDRLNTSTTFSDGGKENTCLTELLCLCRSLLYQKVSVDAENLLDEVRKDLPEYVERYPDGSKKPVQHQQDWALPLQCLLDRLGGGAVPTACMVSCDLMSKPVTLNALT